MPWVVVMFGLLLLVACAAAPNEDDARREVAAARTSVESDYVKLDQVIDMPGTVQRTWSVCEEGPDPALAPAINVSVAGPPMQTITVILDRLAADGWTMQDDSENDGLRSVLLKKGERAVSVDASREAGPDSGADWSFIGRCVKVPDELGDELLDEIE